MKPRNASVSFYDAGDGILRVWCASFDIKGKVPRRPDGSEDLPAIRKKQRQLEKLLETLEIPED